MKMDMKSKCKFDIVTCIFLFLLRGKYLANYSMCKSSRYDYGITLCIRIASNRLSQIPCKTRRILCCLFSALFFY